MSVSDLLSGAKKNLESLKTDFTLPEDAVTEIDHAIGAINNAIASPTDRQKLGDAYTEVHNLENSVYAILQRDRKLLRENWPKIYASIDEAWQIVGNAIHVLEFVPKP